MKFEHTRRTNQSRRPHTQQQHHHPRHRVHRTLTPSPTPCRRKNWAALRLPPRRMVVSCWGVHSSRSTERTKERCTPVGLWGMVMGWRCVWCLNRIGRAVIVVMGLCFVVSLSVAYRGSGAWRSSCSR